MNELISILYPSFYIAKDKYGREFVLLDDSDDHCDFADTMEIESCVETEAFANHVHLFDNAGEKNREFVTNIGINIAKNLLKCLTESFPERKFIVFLDINLNDSVIVRFHQAWEDEPPYYTIQEFKNILEFKNF